ncbi:MAG: EF-P lysine aminoacylase EpmA [Desulfocapsaceae bacterium]
MLTPEGLQFRAALFHLVRSFFSKRGFLEVDTPIRQPVLLPETNIVPLRAGNWFLQTSPEQCMKRLLAAGCENIFQICPCFRAEERGSRHLEEFTMLEWYRVASDYLELMSDCERLLRFVLNSLLEIGPCQPIVVDSYIAKMVIEQPWERLSVAEAFSRYASCSVAEALDQDRFDEVIAIEIEPRLGLGRPTFLFDYPARCASLARLKNDDPGLAERFELYIEGMELANGFSELTDAAEQRRRFAEELVKNEQSRKQAGGVMPERFLAELENLGRAAGIAFGLDRLLMLLMSADSIDEVVSFSPSDWD